MPYFGGIKILLFTDRILDPLITLLSALYITSFIFWIFLQSIVYSGGLVVEQTSPHTIW